VPGSPGSSGDGAVIQTVASGMALSSTAFANGAAIPEAFTCDVPAPMSPPLTYSGIPAGAVELALTVVDHDAGGFVHWFVTGINPAVHAFPVGAAPEGAVELVNATGAPGWSPPCPPKGAAPHRYVFTLYALGLPSGITAATPIDAAMTTLSADAVDTVVLAATYQRSA
jgi:Raf kinase inhibitor-like YbhB/YbcL family protein